MAQEKREKLTGFRSTPWECPFCNKELPEAVLDELFGRGSSNTSTCPSPGCLTRIKAVKRKNGEGELIFQRVDMIQ